MEKIENRAYWKATGATALVSTIISLSLFNYIYSIEAYDSFNAMIILLFVILFVLSGYIFSLFVKRGVLNRRKGILLAILGNMPYLLLLGFFTNFLPLFPMMLFCPIIGLWFGRRMAEAS
jgi:high-affinity Fe2+/Pb2+ permease